MARNAKALKSPSMFLSRIKIGENQKVTSHSGNWIKPTTFPCQGSHRNLHGQGRWTQNATQEAQELPWYRRYWYLIVAAALCVSSPVTLRHGGCRQEIEGIVGFLTSPVIYICVTIIAYAIKNQAFGHRSHTERLANQKL